MTKDKCVDREPCAESIIHCQAHNMSNWLDTKETKRIPKEVEGITSVYYSSISTAENYQYN